MLIMLKLFRSSPKKKNKDKKKFKFCASDSKLNRILSDQTVKENFESDCESEI